MTVRVIPAASGGWLAIVGRDRFLVVESTIDADVLDEAWASIAHPEMFQRTIDLLTRSGLGSTPPFVLADLAGGVRILSRGTARSTVTTSAGELDVDASGVSTWVERHFPDASVVSVSIPGAGRATELALPVETGVSLVAELVASTLGSVSPAAVAPTVAPTPREMVSIDVGATMTVVTATEPAPELRAEPPAAGPSTAIDPTNDGYDYLFGDTMYRSVAEAAVPEPTPDDGPDQLAPVAPELGGDHDGHTVLTSDLRKIRASRRPTKTQSATDVVAAPTVMLVVSSTGAREPLKQPVIIGRNPSIGKVEIGEIPRLITLANDQDISRNHARIALEGGTVVVTDLHSRNGTLVVLPGKEPQKLRAGEPTAVIIGTIVDLGGGVTVTVEEA